MAFSDFDFSTAMVVDKLDQVPEDFRPLYGAKDDKFVLKSEDPTVKGAVSAILAVGKALKKEREANKGKTAVDLTPLKDYGTSVEEISAALKVKLEGYEEKLAGGAKAKLDIDKMKADIGAAHGRELKAKYDRITTLETQLKALLVDGEINKACLAHGGDEFLPEFVRKHVETFDEEGKFKVAVVDDVARTRRINGTTGLEMTIEELVKEMKALPKYGKFFASEAAKGGGKGPGSSGQPVIQQGSQDRISPIDMIRRGLAARQKA